MIMGGCEIYSVFILSVIHFWHECVSRETQMEEYVF